MLKNKKGILAIILCLILVFTAFVGCGDNPTPPDNTPPDTETPEKPEKPEKPESHEYSAEFSAPSYYLAKIDGVETITLASELKCDGTAVSSITPTYMVADTQVATLSDGTLTAVAEGETTVTATYSENEKVIATATAKVAVLKQIEESSVNAFDESAVNLFGRTVISNKRLSLENVCTGIEVAFIGTELSVNVTTSTKGKLMVYVDGDKEGTDFVFSGKTNLQVCKNLSSGIHVVRILKASSPLFGTVSVLNNAFPTSVTYLKPPAKSELKIEVIGDSITAGCGSVGKGGDATVENSDATKTYAFLSILDLDADFSVIALEGICTKDGNNNAYSLYTCNSPNNSTLYNPSDFDADIVIVGLGENDMWHATASQFDYTIEQFRQDYADFLKLIRQYHPNAYIVCAYGMMPAASTKQAAETINGAIADTKDDMVSSVAMLSSESGGNSHPSLSAHKKNAATLAAHIEKLLED